MSNFLVSSCDEKVIVIQRTFVVRGSNPVVKWMSISWTKKYCTTWTRSGWLKPLPEVRFTRSYHSNYTLLILLVQAGKRIETSLSPSATRIRTTTVTQITLIKWGNVSEAWWVTWWWASWIDSMLVHICQCLTFLACSWSTAQRHWHIVLFWTRRFRIGSKAVTTTTFSKYLPSIAQRKERRVSDNLGKWDHMLTGGRKRVY